MKITLIILLIPLVGFSQENYQIETIDIKNFWIAYDLLENAKSKEDSIAIIQDHYIDKSSKYFKEFIRERNFTATEYVKKIKRYPKFWKSIRPLTESIESRKQEIESVFKKYRKAIPNFSQPNVCFAIGCLRTGGTTTKNLILIGSEIAASTSEVDKSEMNGWLKSVIGNSGDIVSMVAHESVHIQQTNKSSSGLLAAVLKEGVADFLTLELLRLTINSQLYDYGDKHELELWKEFKSDLKEYPKGYERWLYQGNQSNERPPDLGYYIGYKIAKSYYENISDKNKAIQILLNGRKYKEIYKKSDYYSK